MDNGVSARDNARDAVLSSRRLIHSLKARADERRTTPEKIADALTSRFGSMGFLIFNVVWFTIWLAWNNGLIPGLQPFDPFPFQLLTMIVSLEAIFLSIIVLISQNRGERVADLRQEMDLQLDILAEDELTKMMRMLALLLEKQGLDVSNDTELQEMLRPTNIEKIQTILEEQINVKK
ncbi:MAG: DUF1003 domain-containing protein [Anaerolineae bacterium]|nr:DUF1003 domain-containing protein [Chloroflexota bacterium]MBN8637114.1 DUF1003 domain-containing protein [Anaerolineae bacterium]